MVLRLRPIISILAVVSLLLTLWPATPAAADAAALSDEEAISLLVSYSIVKGDPETGLNLDQKLTRAQAATLFVRSMGYDSLAQSLRSVVPFPDAQGHWAAGEIAMAQRLSLMKGDPDGGFRPQAEITYAEVLTVLLRMVKQEPAGPWSASAIMDAAARLGIAPQGVTATSPAIRGKIFWSLASAISRIPLPSGQTVLQTYVDPNPPTITLNRTSVSTIDDTATVSGSTQGATQVLVDGNRAVLSPNGTFTYTGSLNVGTHEWKVEAFDLAGNKASAVFTAERKPRVARIEISGAEALKIGSSTQLTIRALDANDQPVSLDWVDTQVTGNVATFDKATGTLKAGQRVGEGELKLTSGSVTAVHAFRVTNVSTDAKALQIENVNGGNAPALGKATTVKVRVVDDHGDLVEDDYWRNVSLAAAGLAGVTVSPSTATTEAGIATFTVTASQEGAASLTARSGGLTEAKTDTQFLPSPRIVLTATPATLAPDGTTVSTIRAYLKDDAGKPVVNTSNSDIDITLSTTGSYGELIDSTLTIPRNASSSQGADGTLKAGIRPGTVVVSGRVTSGTRYSVQLLSIPVTAKLPGVKLQVSGPSNRLNPGSSATITVRVLDEQNRLVTAGAYAFQFKVSTSQDDRQVNGLPEGVTLTFANSAYKPVDDGHSTSDPLNDDHAVVGRTYQGTATLTLKYTRSGVVTLTPKLLGPTDEAFDPSTGEGPAAASTDMETAPIELTYAGSAAALKLTADSALGDKLPGAAVTPGGTVTIRAQVVDQYGTPVPGYSETISLSRNTSGDNVASISGSYRKTAVNGSAEFTLRTSTTVGFDTFTATSGGLTSSRLTVSVRNQRPNTPDIIAVRGASANDLSPVTGYVAPDDQYMDIQLYPEAPAAADEPTYWATAKVYRDAESTPFYTNAPVNLLADPAIIRVPKALLKPGTSSYRVTIHNGVAESAKSRSSDPVVNATYNTAYKLLSAQYDAQTGKLVLSTSGLSSTGQVDTARLSIVKGNNRVNLSSADVLTITSSTVSIDASDLMDQIDPATFYGQVVIDAEDGWYRVNDGSQVAQGSDTALVKPMALITHATFDERGGLLYLYGGGFSQGTVSLNLISISNGTDAVVLRPGSSTSYDRLTNTTDSQLTIDLSQTTLDNLSALGGPDVYVAAETGWLRTGSGTSTYRATGFEGDTHPVYIFGYANSASYNKSTNVLTIRGRGYTDAVLHPEKLVFRTSTSTTEFRPSSASDVTVVDDLTVTIQFDSTDASTFESRFSGKSVYLNTDAGWLTDGLGRNAAPLSRNSILFSVPR